MKTKILGLLLALTGTVALTSCNPTVKPTNTGSGQGSTSSSGGGGDVDDNFWAEEDEAHVNEQILGAYTSTSSGTDYSAMTSSDRASVLGDIEAWAKKNYLLGIPLFGDGGWSLYSSRVQSPLNKTYVNNYGFGILREGKLTSDMTADQEANAEYRGYLHEGLGSVTAEMNPFDANNSLSSTLWGYMSSSLYAQRLVKDGKGGYEAKYEWYDSYAIGDPTPVDLNAETNTATTWRVKVKTGKNSGLKFKTLSTATIDGTAVSSFNDKEVTVDDYIWAYRVALNGNNKYSYSSQYVTRFAGASNYYKSSTDIKVGTAEDDALWANVGIKKIDEETIEVQMASAYTLGNFRVEADMGICNEAFWKLVTHYDDATNYKPKNYGSPSTDNTLSIADTLLSCGPYILKTFSVGTGSDNEIVFVRNDDWIDKKNEDNDLYQIYQIPGIMFKVNSSFNGTTGAETMYQEYLAGKLDSASIPTARKTEYTVNSPNVYVSNNAAITALQVNSTTEERWNEVYGENGTNWQNQEDYSYDATKAAAYTIKPVMSNLDFLDGIYFSIDRATLADSLMANPSSDWIGEEYMVDLDSNVSYDKTAAHKRAVKDWSPETHGYSRAVSQAKFESAMETLVKEGKYTAGTSANPTVITISLQVAADTQKTNWATKVKSYIEDSFNAAMLSKGFKLVVELPDAPASVLDIYGILASGCFDLAWGGISGGTTDALGMWGCWLDDWPYGLQMSVGVDPKIDTGDIHYKGYTYSAQSIWYAVEAGWPVMIEKGVLVGFWEEEEEAPSEEETTAN